MSTGVAIVGAAECDLGVTGASILGLQTQAVTRALADAGLTLRDVDGIATTGVSRFSATQLADYFGLQPRWTDSTYAGGSAFEMFVARAAQAITAGQAEVVVVSFASGEVGDELVGLPVEIRPLTRPTGVWAGNVFSGVVLQDGEPAPFATVEVEFVNDGSVTAPNDAFITQVLTTDANGTFTYAMPRAGWWGFAALLDGEDTMPSPEGSPAPIETGGLIWVQATEMGGK